MSISILYQDEHFVAINKPNGLLVHRTKIAEEKKEFALQMVRDQIGQRVHAVHRLDRPTSGVLLFALDKTTANAMMEQFRNRIVQKTYYAIVRGYLPEGKQTIDYPLYKGELRSGEKQAAVTHYERLAQIEVPIPVDRYAQSRYSLVRIHPKTGRMHQIRKHFAHLRHPIIGDRKHGDRHHNRMFREKYEMSKLLLHAQELQFTHPSTQQNVYIHAPFSEAMKQVVSLFDWTVHLSLSQ